MYSIASVKIILDSRFHRMVDKGLLLNAVQRVNLTSRFGLRLHLYVYLYRWAGMPVEMAAARPKDRGYGSWMLHGRC